MGFADRVRAWFKGESKRAAPGPSTERASRVSTRELTEFVESRHGVEAFVEPKTALYSTTLLLVAADGEYLRRPVGGPRQAATFCDRHDIPLYDARKVGYPQRMRDYERGQPPRSIGLDEMPPWPGDTPDPDESDAPDGDVPGGDATGGAGEHGPGDDEGPPPPPASR